MAPAYGATPIQVAAVPSTAAAPSPTAPEPAPAVLVHLQSSRLTSIVRVDGPRPTDCVAPCDRELPLAGTYIVEGPGLRPADPFKLEGAPGGRVVVDVSPGFSSRYERGRAVVATSVIGGGLALLGAAAAEVYAAASGQGLPSHAASPHPCESCTVAGVMAISGLVVMVVGGVVGGGVMAANGTSGVSQEASRAPRRELPEQDAVWRQPERSPLPRPTELRLVDLRF